MDSIGVIRKQDWGLWTTRDEQRVAMMSSDSRKPCHQPCGASNDLIYDDCVEGRKIKCTAAMCKDNPNCLKALASLWSAKEAQDRFLAHYGVEALQVDDEDLLQTNTESDPSKRLVGLINLGTTCYLNSLLQIWFHIKDLRSIVFEAAEFCTNSNSLLHHVARVFTGLQTSVSKAYDPTHLVEFMHLPRNEQQDALEYWSMMLCDFDEAFKSLHSPSPQTRLSNLLYAKEVFTITCKACQNSSSTTSEFNTLQLAISDEQLVYKYIENVFRPELLTGADKYQCAHCNSLQDAVRVRRIKSLPKVLNLQLLRFKYNVASQRRLKERKAVLFPLQLPAKLFSVNNTAVYELKAVLLHAGENPTCGHYVAHVYSEENKAWIELNDTEATILKKPTFAVAGDGFESFGVDTDSPSSAKKTKKSKKAINDERTVLPPDLLQHIARNGLSHSRLEHPAIPLPPTQSPKDGTFNFDRAALHAGLPWQSELKHSSAFKSEQAYLLVYVLKDETPKQINLDPPVALMKSISDENGAIKEKLQAKKQRYNEFKAVFESRKQGWIDFFKNCTMNRNSQDSYYVNSGVLKCAVQFELEESASSGSLPIHSMVLDGIEAPAAVQAADVLKSPPKFELDNKDIVCSHGLLHPAKIWSTKRLALSAPTYLSNVLNISIKPLLELSDFCHDCFNDTVHAFDILKRQERIVKNIAAFQKDGEMDNELSYYVSSSWYNQWKKKSNSFKTGSPDSTAEYMADVKCEHGNLNPDASKRLLIPNASYFELTQIYPSFHSLDESSLPCAECEMKHELLINSKKDFIGKANHEAKTLTRLAKSVRMDLYFNMKYFCIPTTFLIDWKAFINDPVLTLPPKEIDTRSFFCKEHHMLVHDFDKDSSYASFWTIIMESEWEQFKSIYGHIGDPITSKIVPDQMTGKPKHLTEPIVCEKCRRERLMLDKTMHIKIIYKGVETPKSWSQLASGGGANAGENGIFRDETSPMDRSETGSPILVPTVYEGVQIEDSSKTSKKRNRDSLELSAKVSSDDLEIMHSKMPQWKTNSPTTTKKAARAVVEEGRRRSTRSRASKQGSEEEPIMYDLECNVKETVRDIKEAVAQLINEPVIYVLVYNKGVLLEDHEVLGDLKIVSSDILEYKVFRQPVDNFICDDFEIPSETRGVGYAGPIFAEDFDFSGLFDESPKKPDVVVLGKDESKKVEITDKNGVAHINIQCPTCTFVNSLPMAAKMNCEMCESQL